MFIRSWHHMLTVNRLNSNSFQQNLSTFLVAKSLLFSTLHWKYFKKGFVYSKLTSYVNSFCSWWKPAYDGKRRRLVCVKKPLDLVTDFRFASRILWKFSKKYVAFLEFVLSCIYCTRIVQVNDQKISDFFSPQFFQNVD